MPKSKGCSLTVSPNFKGAVPPHPPCPWFLPPLYVSPPPLPPLPPPPAPVGGAPIGPGSVGVCASITGLQAPVDIFLLPIDLFRSQTPSRPPPPFCGRSSRRRAGIGEISGPAVTWALNCLWTPRLYFRISRTGK